MTFPDYVIAEIVTETGLAEETVRKVLDSKAAQAEIGWAIDDAVHQAEAGENW